MKSFLMLIKNYLKFLPIWLIKIIPFVLLAIIALILLIKIAFRILFYFRIRKLAKKPEFIDLIKSKYKPKYLLKRSDTIEKIAIKYICRIQPYFNFVKGSKKSG